MRIERLAQNKIVVMLTSDDLVGLDINVHTLNDDKNVLNRFLIHVMEVIREETGFNPYSGQIVVEAKSIREGLVITVSKLGDAPLIKKGPRHITARVKKSPDRTETFYFDSFDDVCDALMRLDGEIYESCELYKIDDIYVMLLCCNRFNKENKGEYFGSICVLSEYSSRTSVFDNQHCHVREHGRLIAKGEKLKSMAEGLRKIYEKD
ncbi:MAG: adaptor protein MecA [Clostridiales bacterium]|nr:adaptor protein MecA [Clostridiales bacterium]